MKNPAGISEDSLAIKEEYDALTEAKAHVAKLWLRTKDLCVLVRALHASCSNAYILINTPKSFKDCLHAQVEKDLD